MFVSVRMPALLAHEWSRRRGVRFGWRRVGSMIASFGGRCFRRMCLAMVATPLAVLCSEGAAAGRGSGPTICLVPWQW